MDMEYVVALGQQAIYTVLLLGGPLLLSALLIGTTISILQSVTQVQEMTLVFVPKMLAVFVVLAVAGGWMLQIAVAFGTGMFEAISTP